MKQETTQTIPTSNKNAYEIRLEILKMANATLLEEYRQKLVYEQQDVLANPSLVSKYIPTPKQVSDYAKELYAFVENKQCSGSCKS